MSQTRAQLLKGFSNTSAPDDAITVDSSGKFGIGVAPATNLDVSSTSRMRLDVSNAYTLQTHLNAAGSAFASSIASAADFQFQISNAEKVRFQSGGGISFNGDTAAANALDDYEEGTWTPGLTFNNNATGMTFARQEGVYVKIGNIVHVTGTLQLSNKGTSTGAARLTGLPYNIGSSAAAFTPIADRGGINLGSNGQGAAVYMQNTSTPRLYGYYFDGVGNFSLQHSHFASNSSELDVNFSYIV